MMQACGSIRSLTFFATLFKPRKKLKVTYKKPKTDYEYNRIKTDHQAKINMILDKIQRAVMTVLPKKKKTRYLMKARIETDNQIRFAFEKKSFIRSCSGVNVLFALSLLMSYLAVHISPEKFYPPAFFGLAYPYILLINILFIIAWAVLLRYEALISVIVIAAAIPT